jgi:hypothetical protein
MQNSLFDLENRYASLSKTGDPLERLNAIIEWEIFCPILERVDKKERKSQAGRKPTSRTPHVQDACLATTQWSV